MRIRASESEIASTEGKIEILEDKISLTSILMPVAGTVAELKTKDSGELLNAGAVVASIVPEGVPLEVMASLPSRDIGFVSAGLPAQVKVDAYPFEQYGTLPAQVSKVIPNVGKDENFTILLSLEKDKIDSDGKTISLFPGLTVQADLMTSKKRLLSLLFAR